METFVKGNLVILEYPYSDFKGAKKRPALIVAGPFSNDVIICPIRSRLKKDEYCIDLEDDDLNEGSLKLSSLIRTNFISTADQSIIIRKIGHLKDSKIKEVEDKLVRIITD